MVVSIERASIVELALIFAGIFGVCRAATRRLQKLHEEWGNYNEHAKDAAYTSRWNSGYAELQEIIVRLLTNNPIPRLAPLWKQAVEDCVTDDCRARLSARARDVPAR